MAALSVKRSVARQQAQQRVAPRPRQALPPHARRVALQALAEAAPANGKASAPAPTAASPKAKAAPAAPRGFTNINKFEVPPHLLAATEAAWRRREALMKGQPGFLAFEMKREGTMLITKSSWASIPEWEAWNLRDDVRRSHMPAGIFQWVPGKGEGFPEDFVPFVDYDAAVAARY